MLELVASHHLFALFAAADEGDLSSHRTALVNNSNPSPNPNPNPDPQPNLALTLALALALTLTR